MNDRSFAFALSALVFVASCGSESPANPDAHIPDTVELRGTCEAAEHIGGFTVASYEGYSAVDGRVANGVVPVTIRELVASEGDCKLMRKRNPFCDPACGSGFTCDHSGTCIAFPESQNVGTVSVAGLAKQVQMDALEPGKNYLDTQMPHPAFDAGDVIALTSTNGAYGELELFGVGGETLVTPEDILLIERNQALSVTWTAPTAAEVKTRVYLELSIDQHGNSPIALKCDVDDSGSHEVPASLINALLDAGVSGFPNATLVRRTVDKVMVSDGCVEFTVSFPRQKSVRVSGHTPCMNNTQCPKGQTCDIPNQTCI